MMEKVKEVILPLLEQSGGVWGIVIEDLDQRIRWEHNKEMLFTAESIIKIPIMAAVFAAIEQKQLQLQDQITITRADLVGGSGVLHCLSPGLRLAVNDLITLMIIQSDNTATNLLIDLVGDQQIQQAMRDLGMKKSYFRKKLMIYPVDTPDKNEITAEDISELLKRLATGKYVSQDACEQMIHIMKKQQFRNGLPAYLSSESDPMWELANKTGWDTGSQHDVGIFYVAGRTFTISALSRDVKPEVALDILAKIGREIYLCATNNHNW